jgi:porphobilinogen synthase
VEGTNIKEEISSMPSYFRYSLDNITVEGETLWSLGINSFAFHKM